LVGIQDSKSRYRSVDPRAMPKFGSEKKLNTDVARESEAKPSVAISNVESSKAQVKKTPAPSVRTARSDGWVSQWGSKLSSLVSQKPKPARGVIPRINGVAVQGELSLDNIRVVRNDLSDADLEVVARKTAAAKEVEVGRASSRAADGIDFERSSARGATRTGQDARPTMSAMFSAVNP
jgi:hypothetical protein